MSAGSSPSPRSSSTVTSPEVQSSTRGIIRVGRRLVPDPDVLHLQLEERVGGLRDVLHVELVAEVGAVRGQHAVAKQRVDRAVLLLEAELELGLELVELVEVAHGEDCSSASRAETLAAPGDDELGVELGERLEHEAARSCRRGWGTVSPARRSSRRRRGAGRGRSSAGPQRSRAAHAAELALDREQPLEQRPRARARSRARRRR